MKITLTFINRDLKGHKREKTVEIFTATMPSGSLGLEHLKGLWTIEQVFNNLPGTNTHVHVDISE